jgi:ATP-binding cassette, subfamily B, bacterial
MSGTWHAIISLATVRARVFVLMGVLIGCAAYGVQLVPGLLIRSFIDALSGGAPVGLNAWTPLALLATFALIRPVVLMSAVGCERFVQLVVSTLLRRNVLEHILRQPGAQPLPASPGEAISRFRDDVQSVALGLTWMLDPVGQAIAAAFVVVALLRIDATLTLGVLVPLLVIVSMIRLLNARIGTYRRAAQQSIADVTGLLGEVFGAALAIKLANAEQRVVAHLRELNDSRRRANLTDRVFAEFLRSASTNVANLGTAVLLLLAAGAMRAGQFTVGDFALFVSYISGLTLITREFGTFMANFRQMEVSLDRLQVLMAGASADALVRHVPHLGRSIPGPTSAEPELEEPLRELVARGLTFSYPGSRRGMVDVSFRLTRGSFTVITGRIGAGKTTLLRVLLGLLPMDSGAIWWNGRPVLDPASVFVPPLTSYTPQAPRLVSETLRDNILLGIPEHAVDLDRVVHAAVLEADLPDLEEGLDTLVGPRGVKLSGGQIQRVAAARMFARRAELLIVDDLSSALDVETEKLLWERLLDQPSLTCVAVSHRHAALRRADQILLMKDGRLLDHGTAPELLERCDEMRRLWETSIAPLDSTADGADRV